MRCTSCAGTGRSTRTPSGLCPICRGTGYYNRVVDEDTREYTRLSLEATERRHAAARALKQTYGKNELPELPAVKD